MDKILNKIEKIEDDVSTIKYIIIGIIIGSFITSLGSIIYQIRFKKETTKEQLPEVGKTLKLDNGYEIYTVINKPDFKLIYLTKDKNIKSSLVKIDEQWLVLE